MSSRKIMIIEDEIVVAKIYKQCLERRGYKIAIMAQGASEALQKLSHSLSNGGKPDLVIADRRLPDGDGVEVCRQVVQMAPGTNIVLATADPVDKSTSDEAGISMQLVKPFTMKDLISAVENGSADGAKNFRQST